MVEVFELGLKNKTTKKWQDQYKLYLVFNYNQVQRE
jgi:hypothetical protein